MVFASRISNQKGKVSINNMADTACTQVVCAARMRSREQTDMPPSWSLLLPDNASLTFVRVLNPKPNTLNPLGFELQGLGFGGLRL